MNSAAGISSDAQCLHEPDRIAVDHAVAEHDDRFIIRRGTTARERFICSTMRLTPTIRLRGGCSRES
jgi:hypothetical protein